MPSNTLILNSPQIFCGLGTLTYTISSTGAGLYNVHCECLKTPPSGLSIVVNQNGSAVYTSTTLTTTQSAVQFKTTLNCANSDVITVVLSSSTAVDLLLNTVKTSIAIGTGL